MAELNDAAEAAFKDEPYRAYGDTYLQSVRENWNTCRALIAKAFVVGLGIIATYELLIRAAIAKVAIGGLEIQDLVILRQFLPVLLAFAFYVLCMGFSEDIELELAYNAALKTLYPKLYHSERLRAALEPPDPSLAYSARGMASKFSGILLWATFLGIPAYVGYAYVVYLLNFPFGFLICISMLCALFLLVYAFAIGVNALKSSRASLLG